MSLSRETTSDVGWSPKLPAQARVSGREIGRDFKVDDPHSLDPAICWQAIYNRDQRFDGRFFAAATSTGLYCRNTCPVPFAKPKNIVLFACAAAAEAAGFRPCRRCQPQAAPGTPAWLGSSAVVSRAFRLILEGALNDGNVDQLAERLGIGSRHLRRLFVRHLGASPIKIATTQRIHLARKLLDESRLPITKIAQYAGFKSIREFNHAIRLSTGQSPSALRRLSGDSLLCSRQTGLELRLPYRPPFDWDHLIDFLRQRAIRGIEVVSRDSYSRTIEAGGAFGALRVTQDKAASRLIIHLDLPSYDGLSQIVERVRRIFDLNADPVQIASHLSHDPRLKTLLGRYPGLRVPGVWDGFEGAVLAILGQKLSSIGNNRDADRLTKYFGIPFDSSVKGLDYLFPHPEDLANADLSLLGLSTDRAKTLQKLASAVACREVTFDNSKPLEETIEMLRATCDIDESTAQWIAMRSCGEPDAFPARDGKLRRRLGGGVLLPVRDALQAAEQWRPWRAYAALHLTV
jgi:AraC family transcriptional regulator, regulatory protein of adaptative response / DNA-3-methyladenine glycosylase II